MQEQQDRVHDEEEKEGELGQVETTGRLSLINISHGLFWVLQKVRDAVPLPDQRKCDHLDEKAGKVGQYGPSDQCSLIREVIAVQSVENEECHSTGQEQTAAHDHYEGGPRGVDLVPDEDVGIVEDEDDAVDGQKQLQVAKPLVL